MDSFLGEIFTATVVAYRPTFHFFLHIFHHIRVFSLVHLVVFTFLHRLEMFLDGSKPPETFLAAVTDVLDVFVDGDTLSPAENRILVSQSVSEEDLTVSRRPESSPRSPRKSCSGRSHSYCHGVARLAC